MSQANHIDVARRRGRGAVSNRAGRFESQAREEAWDGWDIPEDRPRFATELREERAGKVITRNTSPDVPFDRSLNIYRGCEHGCVYCFARPTHAYLGLSPGLDFETKLIAKVNAPEQLARELGVKGYVPAPLAIGTNTDPYQPCEREAGLMRACLKVLWEHRHPVAIVTKGTLIERDLDILAPMAAEGLVRVGVSVTTLRDEVARSMEPRVPRPARRLATIQALAEAGVPVRIMASPMIPGLTDPELEAILEAGAGAGATSASWIMLRLPREVSELVQEWLAEDFPNVAGRVMARLREMHGGKDYAADWHHRMRGTGHYAHLVARRFDVATRRLGLDQEQPELRCDLFRVPGRGAQLSLF